MGRNGSKSTLFRLLTGEFKPDGGVIEVQQGIRVASLIQEVPRDMRGSIADVVAAGIPGVAECLHDYHVALEAVNQDPLNPTLNSLARVLWTRPTPGALKTVFSECCLV